MTKSDVENLFVFVKEGAGRDESSETLIKALEPIESCNFNYCEYINLMRARFQNNEYDDSNMSLASREFVQDNINERLLSGLVVIIENTKSEIELRESKLQHLQKVREEANQELKAFIQVNSLNDQTQKNYMSKIYEIYENLLHTCDNIDRLSKPLEIYSTEQIKDRLKKQLVFIFERRFECIEYSCLKNLKGKELSVEKNVIVQRYMNLIDYLYKNYILEDYRISDLHENNIIESDFTSGISLEIYDHPGVASPRIITGILG